MLQLGDESLFPLDQWVSVEELVNDGAFLFGEDGVRVVFFYFGCDLHLVDLDVRLLWGLSAREGLKVAEDDLELDVESCSLRRGAVDVRFVFRMFPQGVVLLEVVE